MPPERRQGRAGGVGQDIERITSGVRDEFWPNPFKQQRPKDQVQQDFPRLGRSIVAAQAQAPMQPEDGRQGARD